MAGGLMLMDELDVHYNDSPWLAQNAPDLLKDIRQALKSVDQQVEAINALLLTYPYILPVGNIKQWSQTVRDAFDAYLGEDDLSQTSSIFLSNIKTEAIDRALSAAMRRVRKRIDPPLMLEAYVNLFHLQVYRLSEGIDDRIIYSALDLARIVNDQESYARLHRALAYAYLRRGLYDRALLQARMAYDYYSQHKSKLDLAIAAYAMAASYRFKGELDVAERWLTTAANSFARTRYPRQHAVIAGEMGNILMMRQDIPSAYQWLTIANEEAQLVDPHTRATIQHCYGIIQTDMELYEEAEDSLNMSLRYWQDVDDKHQIAHLLYAFAYLAFKQGNNKEAIAYLDQSSATYDQIEETPFNGQIKEKIAALRQRIAQSTA